MSETAKVGEIVKYHHDRPGWSPAIVTEDAGMDDDDLQILHLTVFPGPSDHGYSFMEAAANEKGPCHWGDKANDWSRLDA